MGNLTRHADPGGAVGEVRGEEGPVGSDHTRRSVGSVVEEGDTAGASHGRPDEPGGRRAEGHQAGLPDRGSLLQEGDDDTEELLVGVVEDRLVEISGTVSRCTLHTSLLPPVAAVAHPVGTPPMPTNDPHVAGPQLVPPGRRPRCGPGCGRRRCAPRRMRRRRPRGARAGAASGTDGRGRPRSGAPRRRRPPTDGPVPRGRASSQTRACSAAASSTAEVATSVAAGPASSSEVAEPRPQGPCAALAG